MKYSKEFKEKMRTKLYNGTSAQQLSKEIRVPVTTIYSWKSQKNGKIKGPNSFSLDEKYSFLLESKKLTENNLGEWLRKNGVHSEHLTKWEKEIAEAMNNNDYKNENKVLKEELKKAQRELNKKDKALAEAAALLVLKKNTNTSGRKRKNDLCENSKRSDSKY